MAVIVERRQFVKDASRERPITIYLNDKPMAVSQGTPENLSELAVGFLLSEGLLVDRDKLRSVAADEEKSVAYVISDENAAEGRTVMRRVTSAGCSETRLLDDIVLEPVHAQNTIRLHAEDISAMMDRLLMMSPRRNNGECVHGCGLGRNGEFECVREDIGRHNAMDKLLGQAWLDRLEVSAMALFTTGRISYEMALKASQGGIAVMVSHKSVTDQAIEAAVELGMTLIGRCRNGRMEVLSWHDRVIEGGRQSYPYR